MDDLTLPQLAAPLCLAGIALVAALHDARTREIPDWAPLAILACAVAFELLGWRSVGGWSIALGLGAGLITGLALWAARFGGGDAKLIAACGAAVGVGNLLPMLALIAIIGGGLALAAAARGRRPFAYGPAIAGGLACAVLAELAAGGLLPLYMRTVADVS